MTDYNQTENTRHYDSTLTMRELQLIVDTIPFTRSNADVQMGWSGRRQCHMNVAYDTERSRWRILRYFLFDDWNQILFEHMRWNSARAEGEPLKALSPIITKRGDDKLYSNLDTLVREWMELLGKEATIQLHISGAQNVVGESGEELGPRIKTHFTSRPMPGDDIDGEESVDSED